ncbi:MAG: four helix bundle protein [Gemmatimonadota bacterium]
MAFVFEKLRVYRQAEEHLRLAYEVAAALPVSERYDLARQLRRAALSVPLNIAESTERRGAKDRARFLRIALGSTVEVVACLRIALRFHDLDPALHDRARASYESLYRQLHAYRHSIDRT